MPKRCITQKPTRRLYMLIQRYTAGPGLEDGSGSWWIEPLESESPTNIGKEIVDVMSQGFNVVFGTKEDLKKHTESCLTRLIQEDGDLGDAEIEIWEMVGKVTTKQQVKVDLLLD